MADCVAAGWPLSALVDVTLYALAVMILCPHRSPRVPEIRYRQWKLNGSSSILRLVF